MNAKFGKDMERKRKEASQVPNSELKHEEIIEARQSLSNSQKL